MIVFLLSGFTVSVFAGEFDFLGEYEVPEVFEEDKSHTSHERVVPRVNPVASLVNAASQGRLDHVREWLDSGVSVSVVNYAGRTPLQEAIENLHTDVVFLLLARGANAGGEDEVGDYPLFYVTRVIEEDTSITAAQEEAMEDITQELLINHADPNVENYSGNTPLMHAVVYGLTGVADILIEYGAARMINHQNEDGNTPLHLAVIGDYITQQEQIDMVIKLLSLGADRTITNDDEETPLAVAERMNLHYLIPELE